MRERKRGTFEGLFGLLFEHSVQMCERLDSHSLRISKTERKPHTLHVTRCSKCTNERRREWKLRSNQVRKSFAQWCVLRVCVRVHVHLGPIRAFLSLCFSLSLSLSFSFSLFHYVSLSPLETTTTTATAIIEKHQVNQASEGKQLAIERENTGYGCVCVCLCARLVSE